MFIHLLLFFVHMLLLFFVHMLQGHIAKQPMAEYVTLLKYISNKNKNKNK